MLYTTRYASPLGAITIAAHKDAVTGLWLEGQKYYAATIKGPVAENKDLPVFTMVRAWLDDYFAGKNPSLTGIPLAPGGSQFRQAVWEILCAIPYGQCTTYGDIAKTMATRMQRATMSSQAVGGAVGHNPISILIPCHRVVGAKGSLTGYAGGISKKIALLELEGVDMAQFFVPKKGTAL